MSDINWDVVSIPEVEEAISKAAAVVAREYDGVVERDDLKQEAYILCASNADRVLVYVYGEGREGHLYRWIWSRLVDIVRPQANRSNQNVSLSRFPID